MNALRHSCYLRSTSIARSLIESGVLRHGQRLEDYLQRNKMADRSESVFDVFSRATHYLAAAGRPYYGDAGVSAAEMRFLEQVASFQVILGSPMLTNGGRRDGKGGAACSIPPVRFKEMSKIQIAKMVGEYHTRGMGTGFCFDDLEDPCEMVKFLNDFAVKEVQQGKIERSCSNMGVLSIDHPRVLEFIRIKKQNPDIREWKFNISVNMTNAFMAAWESKTPFRLKDGTGVDPDDLMREIAENAHATGDPGVLFMDRINELNRLPQQGVLQTVVPCGEVSMFDGEVCQFAYLNLSRFVENQELQIERLKEAVHTTVLLLDNTVEANIASMPTQESAHAISSIRRIGVGVCGFSEMLQQVGVAYDSTEGRAFGHSVMSLINFESKRASIELAEKRGPFPAFLTPGTRKDLFLKRFRQYPTDLVTASDWDALAVQFQKLGIRNVATTIVPPSGRSSLLGGVTGAIEPPFSLVADDAFTQRLYDACERYGYSGNLEKVVQHVRETGSVQDTDLHPEVKKLFQCALEVSPEGHLQMTAAVQLHVDEGISKTINLPYDATVKDVEKIFNSCFKSGLKGMTVYRDGSRTLQPKCLNTKKDASNTTMTTVRTLYGPIKVTPKIAQLLESPLVRRLDAIRQNGVAYLIDPRQSTTRYEHSIGVMSLAQLLGADEAGQIAALLHDISHTAFSHLADLVFTHKMQDYHEVMRERFLLSDLAQETLVALGLNENELSSHQVALIKGAGVNADRLDYCIRDLLATNRIFQPEYAAIVHNLVIDSTGAIRCKDLDTARLLFRKFIEVNKEVYFDERVEAASLAMAVILQRMLKDDLLTDEDFFRTDEYLLQKIAQGPYKEAFSHVGPNMKFSRSKLPTNLPPVVRKLRSLDPIVVGLDGGLTNHCPDSHELLKDYLQSETTIYYNIPLVDRLC